MANTNVLTPEALEALEVLEALEADPFDLDVTVTTEFGGDRMPKACGTSDGCAPTCASSCASAV